MKSFGDKTIRTENVRVKSFVNDMTIELEVLINKWFESTNYEIISINFTDDGNKRRAFIIYKI